MTGNRSTAKIAKNVLPLTFPKTSHDLQKDKMMLKYQLAGALEKRTLTLNDVYMRSIYRNVQKEVSCWIDTTIYKNSRFLNIQQLTCIH